MAVVVIAVLWTVPSLGLLVTSLRPAEDARATGWWTVPADPRLTLDNYAEVLSGSGRMADQVLHSFAITVPSVLFPLVLALCAAYALAWIDFPGRDLLFVGVFALQVVPLQMAFVPLLRLFSDGWGFLPAFDPPFAFGRLWLAHTAFALPFGIYLLHTFVAALPRELLDAARADGAGHAAVLLRVVLPLTAPALASFAILQFLWVWNDLSVALVLGGGAAETAPVTLGLARLSGTYGESWHLLAAGAFVSAAVPVTVFLLLQRHFVRGLLAGGVKG
ncbi:carbohydrate ABC transporter permease [Actinocorallia aurea]